MGEQGREGRDSQATRDGPATPSEELARLRQRCPILLLDVDGVIAPFGAKPDDGGRWREVRGGQRQGAVWHDRDVTERLAAWHHAGRIQLRRLTTWLDDANRVLADEFGFGQLTVHVHPSPDPEPNMWWKNAVVRDLLKDPRCIVVWCDDQMVRQDPHTGVDTDRGDVLAAEFRHRLLPISPDPTSGLRDEHLDEITALASRGVVRRVAGGDQRPFHRQAGHPGTYAAGSPARTGSAGLEIARGACAGRQ